MATLPILVLSALLLTLILTPAGEAKQSHGKKRQRAVCPNAVMIPTRPRDAKRLERATRCLINQERRLRGLKPLRQNKLLQLGANWQAQDMLQHHYFDHARSDGPSFTDRMMRFGYGQDADDSLVGENLAWASTPIATPKAMVRMWMNSPQHRENILTPAFRDQAVTALWADPRSSGGAYSSAGGPYLIYVNQFGRRY